MDTTFLRGLFNFDYVWEGFFKPETRRWGYYVLPIVSVTLRRRIEPRIEGKGARVDVLGLWWSFAPQRTDGFVEAMRDALGAYLRFAGRR